MKKIRKWTITLFFYLFGISIPLLHAAENPTFYSQATQDEFVYTLLYKLLGTQEDASYLEIGAFHPTVINNTYFFEKNYNWKGVSIDISNEFEAVWHSTRQNSLIIQDATKVDYSAILLPFPPVIDYLSLDIDSSYDIVLRKIPFDSYMFKIITIEHDFYKFGDLFRKKEREILSSHGYYLLCPDVSIGKDAFEDWWIHPNAFPEPVFSFLKSLNLGGMENKQIAQILRTIP